MSRKRKRNAFNAGELNLTAMIDVAFQLLAFFIITVRPVDVMATLTVYRPSPVDITTPVSQPPMVRIQILPDGLAINDRDVTAAELNVLLLELAKIDKVQTVLLLCADAAPHKRLVEVLDTCAKVGLSNLSVVSAAGK